MVELCDIASRGQRVIIFETNLTRCFFHLDGKVRSKVEWKESCGGVKVYWKRNGNGLSVSRSRQKRRFYRVCTRACMRPPTRSRRAHAELEYICITRTRRKIKGQECEKTRHVIAGKGMNFSHGDRVYLRSVMVFHLDEKIWLRAVKRWIMQRTGLNRISWKTFRLAIMRRDCFSR